MEKKIVLSLFYTGVITALIGGPLFLKILAQKR